MHCVCSLVFVAAMWESVCDSFHVRDFITLLPKFCDILFNEHFIDTDGDDDSAVELTIAQQVNVVIEAQLWLNPYASDCTHFFGWT